MVLRFTLVAIGTILAVLFLIPIFILGIFNAGNCIGLCISAVLIIYGTFTDQCNKFILYLTKSLWGKSLLILTSLIVVFCFLFACVVTFMIVSHANRPCNEETTVVVLGCRVRKTGASMMLRTRLDAAYEYLIANPNAKCVLSGGQGKDEPVAESVYMYEWLVEKGIDGSRLYVEDKSTSTEENLAFSKKVIEENGLPEKITIITNDFHQYRAYRFAKEAGIESYSYSANTPLSVLPTYYVREILGVAHMIFID